MAIKKHVIDGYGQLELNNVAFRRDGRIEAQCALDSAFSESVPLENGMLVAVDKANNKIKLPGANETLPIALNYTTEHMYDEREPGLKNFKLTPDSGFYPRVGFLSVGDRWTTNCYAYNDSAFANETALDSALASCASTPVYAGYGVDGRVVLDSALPTVGPKLQVVKYYNMPDGQKAVKLMVVG